MNISTRHLQIILSVLACIAVFIIPSLAGQTLILSLFVTLALFNSRRKEIFRFFLKFLALILITLFVHLFFRFGENAYWEAFASRALWEKALYFTARNTAVLFIMSYLIMSGSRISLSSMVAYLEKRGTSEYIQSAALAMRYTSLIRDEFRSLQQVHRIMGIRRPKNVFLRVRYYSSLIVPTIISSLERAEQLSIAMTSRGYNQEL